MNASESIISNTSMASFLSFQSSHCTMSLTGPGFAQDHLLLPYLFQQILTNVHRSRPWSQSRNKESKVPQHCIQTAPCQPLQSGIGWQFSNSCVNTIHAMTGGGENLVKNLLPCASCMPYNEYIHACPNIGSGCDIMILVDEVMMRMLCC